MRSMEYFRACAYAVRLMAGAVKIPHQDESLIKTRRRQIFLAACRVLARKSFHQATVKEIALEAGIAAGSVYLYLRSKDEILLLLADSMVGELVEGLPEIRADSAGDPRRELLGIMRRVLDIIDRYREAFAVLNHEVRYLARRQRYKASLQTILEPYLSSLGSVLKRGREMALMQVEDVASVVEAVHMLCSGWSTGTGLLEKTDKETYWREISNIIQGRFFIDAA